MKVVVTGADGFLGARLADALLAPAAPLRVSELLLVDVRAPRPRPRADPRVRTLALDLAAAGAAARALPADAAVLFHLAAVVSGHAEADFQLGLRVNLDATRALLEAARPALRFVFASTVGVYGGELPAAVDERTAVTPQTSYGAAKAMSELLVCEYARRGLVDGVVVRLPTVAVRAAPPNRAVTSYASDMIREPLLGRAAACPVPPDQALWVTGARAAVRNLARAALVPAAALADRRALNLPGVRVTARDMLAALRRAAGADAAALVRFEPDDLVSRMVASFPTRFDNSRALSLGFTVDESFDDIVRDYICEDMKKNIE